MTEVGVEKIKEGMLGGLRKSSWYLLVCAFLLLGCQVDEHAVEVPERPANVPVNATWSGGLDGGDWFACKPAQKKWTYECTVYDEFSGEIEDNGEYKLVTFFWDHAQNKQIVEKLDSLSLQYASFDGDSIELRNSIGLVKKESLERMQASEGVRK